MNVIISNQQDNVLNDLNIEVIKSLHGEYSVDELITSFSNFFFARMIIDVTAIKDYQNIINFQKLSIGLPVDKIILLIPSQTQLATNSFLSKLISMGYYNFTTNLEGIEYLLNNPNSYKDVAHIHQIVDTEPNGTNNSGGSSIKNVIPEKYILGIKNVTVGAGATTLTYLIYKELIENGINTLAIEVNKRDFIYFNDKSLLSVSKNDLANILLKNHDYNVILVDLNDGDNDICTDVLYLVEPSIIKMNKLMLKDSMTFSKLKGKKIILNKTFISDSDVRQFETEAGIKVFFKIPAIDDRTRPESISQLLAKMGLINYKRNN